MKLMIIEGVGKKDTIKKYLGSDYEVFASRGHVRDLPQRSLAVDIKNNFEPHYEPLPDKKEVIKELLTKAKKADEIILATDPDREGEAISWHLAYILGLDKNLPCRVTFNSISQDAISEGLKNPRIIDQNLVDAQQARRILDRLVGYKLSPFVSRNIKNNLSAGRVQSVTLKLVVDREREIQNFKPEEFWTLTATMIKSIQNPSEPSDKLEFTSQYVGSGGKKSKIKNKAEMQAVLKELDGADYIVRDVKKGETLTKPSAPYITSTMQQDALNKLSFPLSKTTSVAQKLYEGVDIAGQGKSALVTYIRTDSTRVAPIAQENAKKFILDNFGAEYYPKSPNIYKSKKSAQDAHEAIRPIDINRTPKSLEGKIDNDCYKLYKLIYERFLASQMSPAKFYSVSADIDAQTPSNYNFKATGRTLIFPGFMKVYKAYSDEEETEQDKMPNLESGDKLTALKLKDEQKFTKPPARYTEASLVKTMEDKGIGRPATYTPTITLLASRGYTTKDGKFIVPTDIAYSVTDLLSKHFKDIMDITFTANMESRLDDIEDGGIDWHDVVGKFWRYFEKQLLIAGETAENLKSDPIPTDLICEKCGKPMVVRDGKFGQFIACSNYPNCKNILKGYKVENNVPVKIEMEQTQEISDIECDKCGAKMVYKTGRYGRFLACPNYPKCKNIKRIEDKQDYGKCPKCGKDLIVKYNKSRKPFIGCSGYPNCDYAKNINKVEDKPAQE